MADTERIYYRPSKVGGLALLDVGPASKVRTVHIAN